MSKLKTMIDVAFKAWHERYFGKPAAGEGGWRANRNGFLFGQPNAPKTAEQRKAAERETNRKQYEKRKAKLAAMSEEERKAYFKEHYARRVARGGVEFKARQCEHQKAHQRRKREGSV